MAEKITKNLDDVPNGGFPPIYQCDKTVKRKVSETQFGNVLGSVKISTILEQRKINPFLEKPKQDDV